MIILIFSAGIGFQDQLARQLGCIQFQNHKFRYAVPKLFENFLKLIFFSEMDKLFIVFGQMDRDFLLALIPMI